MFLTSTGFCRKRHCIPNSKLLLLTSSLLLGLLLLAGPLGFAQMPAEKPKGYVSDFAGVLSPAVQQQLENLSTELDQKTHAQLAVVTVKSLEGKPLEDFTIDLATRWGIGRKAKTRSDEKADRGVLLFLAIQDRRSRIEVGYGLEPIIPDGKAGSILRSMTPYLRNGDYDSAVLVGSSSIAAIIAQDARVTLGASIFRPAGNLRSENESAPSSISLIKILLILLFLFPFLLFSRRRGPYGGFWSGGGGGFGGGGGGFGGFGGGSFGGGGASGSW